MTKIFSYEESVKSVRKVMGEFGFGPGSNVYPKFPEPLIDLIFVAVVTFVLITFTPSIVPGVVGVIAMVTVVVRSVMDVVESYIPTRSSDYKRLAEIEASSRRFPFRLLSVSLIGCVLLSLDLSIPGRPDSVLVATGLMMIAAVILTVLNDPSESYSAELGRHYGVRFVITFIFIAVGIAQGPILKDYLLSLPEGAQGNYEYINSILPSIVFAFVCLFCLSTTDAKNKIFNALAAERDRKEAEKKREEQKDLASEVMDSLYKETSDEPPAITDSDGFEHHDLKPNHNNVMLAKNATSSIDDVRIARYNLSILNSGVGSSSRYIVLKKHVAFSDKTTIMARLMHVDDRPNKLSSLKRQLFKAKRSSILARKR